jgi:hypothetical protein
MKEPYVKPEIITQDYSTQVFLGGTCYQQDNNSGFPDGSASCYFVPGMCEACPHPTENKYY